MKIYIGNEQRLRGLLSYAGGRSEKYWILLDAISRRTSTASKQTYSYSKELFWEKQSDTIFVVSKDPEHCASIISLYFSMKIFMTVLLAILKILKIFKVFYNKNQLHESQQVQRFSVTHLIT